MLGQTDQMNYTRFPLALHVKNVPDELSTNSLLQSKTCIAALENKILLF